MQKEKETAKLHNDINHIVNQAVKDLSIQYDFKERDYIKFNSFLKYVHDVSYYIRASVNGRICIENSQPEHIKNFITKGFYLLLYNVLTDSFVNDSKLKSFILNKLTELYRQGFFDETEILLYVKFLIILGSKKSNIFRFAFVLLNKIIASKNDNNISNQIIYNIIKFTKETVVLNNKKKYLLPLMTNIIDLLMFDQVSITEQTQKAINDLLVQMYLFQYKVNLFFNLLQSSINHFDNTSTEFNPSLNARVSLIYSIISEELNFSQKDPFNFVNGFLFEKKQIDGIELKTFNDFTIDAKTTKSKGLTIVFSFKHLHPKNKKIVLLEVCECGYDGTVKNNANLRVIIDSNSLFVEENKYRFPSGKISTECIPIFPNTSYLVILSQQKQSNGSKISLNVNGNTYIDESFQTYPSKFDLYMIKIGTSGVLEKEFNFYGYMGSLLVFNECLDEKMVKHIAALKGNYDMLLFSDQNKKYIEQSVDSFIDELFKQQKIVEKINGIVSTYGIKVYNEKKKKYKENFLDLKHLRFNRKYFYIGKYITPITTKISTTEFLKFEGLKFLQLHCEYYFQLLEKDDKKVTNELFVKITGAIDNIINLIELIMKTVGLSYFENKMNFTSSINTFIDINDNKMTIHSNELMFFFSSITQLILKLAKSLNKTPKSPIIKLGSILSLITMNITTEEQKSEDFRIALRNKLIFFLMNKDLYINDEDTLSSTCSTILNCFENDSRGLLVLSFLELLLSYGTNTKKSNENYKALLEAYIRECIAKYRKEMIFAYLQKIMMLYENKNDIEVIEYMTMILCRNLIDYYLSLKDGTKAIKDDWVYRNFFINDLVIVNEIKTNDEKEIFSIEMIKGYLIQCLQIVECDYKAYHFITNKIQFTYKTFISFALLCFYVIPLNQFRALVVLSKEVQEKAFDQYQINYYNLDMKLEFLVALISKESDPEIVKSMQELFRYFLNRLIKDIQSSNMNKQNEKSIQGIFHKKSILYKFFIQFPINVELQNDLKKLIFVIFPICKRPFIFKLLYTLFIKAKYSKDEKLNTIKYINGLYNDIVIINQKDITTMNNQNEIMNQIYNIIFFYQMISLADSKKSLEKYKEVFKIFNCNSIIIANPALLFNRIRFCVGYIREGTLKKAKYKYLSEIVIEIYIELYLLTKEQSYLTMIADLLLKPPEYEESILSEIDGQLLDKEKEKKKTSFFSIFKKKKEETFDIEKLKDNEKKFNHPPNTKFVDVSYLIFYYIKFSLYSVNKKKNNEGKIVQFYNKIKTALYNEIKEMKSKIKKKDFVNEMDDKLYQKFKMYFVFDLIKKKVSKMKIESGSTSSEKSQMKMDINDLDELIIKKTKKPKYKGYVDYFKIFFDKNQKGKYEDVDFSLDKEKKKILTQTFAPGANTNRRESLEKLTNKDNEENEDNEKKIPIFSEEIYSKEQFSLILSKTITSFYESQRDTEDTCYNNYFYYSFPFFNARKVFLSTIFSEFFKDKIYNNEVFNKLVNAYKKKFFYTYIDNCNITYLTYPSKIRNYITENNKIRIFLKPDMKFFTNEYIKISHENLFDYLTFKNSLTSFKNRIYDLNDIASKEIINLLNSNHQKFYCELINIEGALYGYITLMKNYLVFISDCENDPRVDKAKTTTEKMPLLLSSMENDIINKRKILFIRFNHIRKVYIRRFLYSMQANEIHMNSNKTYFFNLFEKQKNIDFLKQLHELLPKEKEKKQDTIVFDLKAVFKEENYVSKWVKGELSTFDFLLMLNFFSCRSFNDINQYPIFPWLTALETNNKNKISIRKFEYPVSIQDKEKRKQIIIKYETSIPTKKGFVNHFNSHYSTSAFVNFFLVRTNPFTYNIIKLQNGMFDHPNRTFHSFYEILEILIKYNDNRELLPEIFCFPEMFINLNFNNLGQRTNDKIRNHNVLFEDYYENNTSINNPSSNNPVEFMCRYKRFLESNIVSKTINEWIDNVFGVYQLVEDDYEECKKRCNTFTKYCYEEYMNFDEKIKKYKNNKISDDVTWRKLRGKICCVLNFGQTPQRILDKKLPAKNLNESKPLKKSSFIGKSKSVNNLSTPLHHLKDPFNTRPFSEYDNKAVLFFESEIINKKRIYFIMQKSQKIFDVFETDNEKKLIKTNINIVTPSFGYYNLFKSPFDKMPLSPVNRIKNIYNLRNTFALLLNGYVYIFTNYLDNSIKLFFWRKNEVYSFITSSFVTSIVKVNELEFITGDENGIITHWTFKLTKENKFVITKKKSVICQQSEVLSLYYDQNSNVIINADSEGVISMRNLFTFELISTFKPSLHDKDEKLLIVKYEINHYNNLLYILAYDIIKKYYVLFGYTVNGIGFSYLTNIAGSFHILNNGNIICYSYAVKAFILVRGERLHKFIEKFDCDIKDKIMRFVYVEEELKIYYLKKKSNETSLYLDTKELSVLDIEKINKEERYMEGKKNCSIWDKIEYEKDIIEHKGDKKDDDSEVLAETTMNDEDEMN